MQCFVGKFQYLAGGLFLGLDRLPTFGQRMLRSFESSNFPPENWDLPSRSSKLSSWRTEFNGGRNYQLPAGELDTSCQGEILNLGSETAILLGKVWTIRPVNWNLHGRLLEFPTQKAKFNAGRIYHLPACRFNATLPGRTSQFPVREYNSSLESFNSPAGELRST